jgi:hypothetical protein
MDDVGIGNIKIGVGVGKPVVLAAARHITGCLRYEVWTLLGERSRDTYRQALNET